MPVTRVNAELVELIGGENAIFQKSHLKVGSVSRCVCCRCFFSSIRHGLSGKAPTFAVEVLQHVMTLTFAVLHVRKLPCKKYAYIYIILI